MRAVAKLGVLFLMVAIFATLSGCRCGKDMGGFSHQEADSTHTEIRWRYITIRDTVPIIIPVEKHSSVGEDSSHLETDFATSDAFIDSLGKLHHNLESKARQIDVPVSGSGDVITGASYSNGVLTITKGNFPTIKHPVLHTLVFKTKTAGTGPNGIAYGAVTLSSSTVSVNLTAHAKFVPPVFAPARFRSSFIVAVNGITLNYLEDYRVSVGSNSEVVITFTSESGVETDDNIAVTYQADPDAVSALNY